MTSNRYKRRAGAYQRKTKKRKNRVVTRQLPGEGFHYLEDSDIVLALVLVQF